MALSIVIGIAHLAIAATLLGHVRRTARTYPWVVALAAFFAIRGSDRLAHAVHEPPRVFGQLADALVVVTLLLLLVGLRRTIHALTDAYNEADGQRREYARALHDYRQLARHRIANPLAAIRGAIATLRDIDGLSSIERRQLLEIIDQQARRLEHLSLDPRPARAEERVFRAVPEDDREVNPSSSGILELQSRRAWE